MARIPRVTQQIFGASGNVGTGGFGAVAAGNNSTELGTSSSLTTLMGTGAWGSGWLDAVLGSTKFPAIEDMNAVEYVMSTQIAYILQQGAAIEYDAGTTYYNTPTPSIVVKSGTFQFYGSKTNANIGNPLTDTANWQFLGDLSQLVANVFTGGTTTGSANAQVLASTSPATGLTPTNGQVVICTAGFTNTGATTFTVTSPAIGATAINKDSVLGLVALTGGEIHAGDTIYLAWNSTSSVWVLTAGLALGTAAYKAVSDNTKATVASVSGSSVVGNIASFADTAGTVQDSGASATGIAKAFVNFTVSGSACTIQSSLNVTSVTYNSTGNYTVNFTSNFADTKYAPQVTPSGANNTGSYGTKAIGTLVVFVGGPSTSTDPAEVSVSVLR